MEEDQRRIVLAAAPTATGLVAEPSGRGGRYRRGGAAQPIILPPPPMISPYFLPPPQASFPVYHPLGNVGQMPYPSLPYPVPLTMTTPGYFPQFIPMREKSESNVREVRASSPADEITLRAVMEEMLGHVIPDLAREVVNETINDLIISYISHQWSEEPDLPHYQHQAVEHRVVHRTEPKPPVPSRQSSETVMMTERTRPSLLKPFQKKIVEIESEREVFQRGQEPCTQILPRWNICAIGQLSQVLTKMLVEQITFQLLLNSDLDGGVTMATRTYSKAMVTDMIFHHVLKRVISSPESY